MKETETFQLTAIEELPPLISPKQLAGIWHRLNQQRHAQAENKCRVMLRSTESVPDPVAVAERELYLSVTRRLKLLSDIERITIQDGPVA